MKTQDLNALEREIGEQEKKRELKNVIQKQDMEALIQKQREISLPSQTSIPELGSDYPIQKQKLVVAEMLLSHNVNNAKQFLDKPSMKEIVANNF